MLLSKKKKIVLIIIVLSTVILSFVGGQTFARYMSKIVGKGTANIASWSFKVNENEEKLQTISLKSTINNSSLLDNKIAPGTEGEFHIKLDATGLEVGINYVVRFENETQKPMNLKFVYDGKTYNTLSDLQTDLTGVINANDENKIRDLVIGWNWKYETGTSAEEILKSDTIDTQNAKDIDDYIFDIIITGTQIEPQG